VPIQQCAEPHWFGINIQSCHHVIKSLQYKTKDKLLSGDSGIVVFKVFKIE